MYAAIRSTFFHSKKLKDLECHSVSLPGGRLALWFSGCGSADDPLTETNTQRKGRVHEQHIFHLMNTSKQK